jgi:hypothetical protein
MCSGPTISGGGAMPGGGQLIDPRTGQRVPHKVPTTAPTPFQTAMIRARQLIESTESAGGNALRGLALPETKPTAVSDLKNLIGTYIRRPR